MTEIEAAALDINGVAAVAVVPPGSERDLAVFAVASITQEQVLAGLAERLESAKVPSSCHILPELPLTPNGKTDRKRLCALLEAETRELLASRAPKLRQGIRDAKEAGHAYVIIDGTLIPIDRVARDKPFYSGKHKKHEMNLQVIASPDGEVLWVSGALPGSVHDKKAEWIWGALDELESQGLVVLADKGYQGSTWAKVPYKGKNKPEPQKEANRAHANSAHPAKGQMPSSRPGKPSPSSAAAPGAGKLAKAIHVLQLREA